MWRIWEDGVRHCIVLALLLAVAACSPARTGDAIDFLEDVDRGRPLATPAAETQRIRARGRDLIADLYRPAAGAKARLVLVPGAAPEGKDHPRMIALAQALARVGFITLVPDIANLRRLQVSAADAGAIAAAVTGLVALTPGAADRPLGLFAISYAVGPAVIAALDPGVAAQVAFIVGIGGYYDMTALLTSLTTGHDPLAETWTARRAPDPYGRWVFAASNSHALRSERDRQLIDAIARRRLADPGAATDDLTAALGPEGRAVLALVRNRDPGLVRTLLAALPPHIRGEIEALDLARRDLGSLPSRLLLLHGADDRVIPPRQSRALARAARAADLFIIDGFGHVGAAGNDPDRLQLLEAAYRLMELRDGLD